MYSDKQFCIDKKSLPVQACVFGPEIFNCPIQTPTDSSCVYNIKVESRAPLLWDIELHYLTYRRCFFINVPIENCIYIRRIKEIEKPDTEISFEGGDWIPRLGIVTWEKWRKALWARLKEMCPKLLK